MRWPHMTTTLTHPPHFSRYDQLMYDPLHISAPFVPHLLQSLLADSIGTQAIFKMTSPVAGGDSGKLGTVEGEENEALVQRLAQEWSSGSEDEGRPAPAPAQPMDSSTLPLSEHDLTGVESVVEEWTSESENEGGPAPSNTIPHSSHGIPEDNQAAVRRWADEWTSSSEEGNQAPASVAMNPTRPASPVT